MLYVSYLVLQPKDKVVVISLVIASPHTVAPQYCEWITCIIKHQTSNIIKQGIRHQWTSLASMVRSSTEHRIPAFDATFAVAFALSEETKSGSGDTEDAVTGRPATGRERNEENEEIVVTC